jgi:hypothetical protein
MIMSGKWVSILKEMIMLLFEVIFLALLQTNCGGSLQISG